MDKIYLFLVNFLLCFLYCQNYESSYYKNYTNILEKNSKIDIDYLFNKPDIQKDETESSKNYNDINNPSTNIFQNYFYDYYQTSVPLYNEKMKCFFPLKKNISLNLNYEKKNFTKIINISKYYGDAFIRPLKGKCLQFYIERWYYTLCPLMGAMQTLSFIKPNDNKKEEEKQEINYLGYETTVYNDSDFLKELKGEYKLFAEKKYADEISDIYEENLFNNYGKKNKIIGIHKKIVKFFGDNVFDSSFYNKYSKKFVLEYYYKYRNDKKIFEADIIKVISNNMILINQTLDKSNLIFIDKLKKIKILKNENKVNKSKSFFDQNFFVYDEYIYSSKINLALCLNMNCHLTISNINDVFKLDIIVDTKLALLEKGIGDIKLSNNENYCLFYGDDKIYYFGKGEIEEFSETDDKSTFILYGENLDMEKSDEILLLYNDTKVDFNNYVFINDIFTTKYISINYIQKINKTHHLVKMKNQEDIDFFEKKITLDGRYIIVKNNTKNEDETEIKKEDPKYAILGNEKNLPLEEDTKEKTERLVIQNPKEEYTIYNNISNSKEFVFKFELSPYNYNLKDSYITICFSNTKKCKSGEDYEMLIDLKNEALIVKKYNKDFNSNDSLTYSMINFKNNANKIKSGIIFINSTIYFNSVFKEEKKFDESEIKLKYEIKNDSYAINYIIINHNKSNNIYIENMEFDDNVSFELFKNIFFYNQKFLLDDNAVFIDTFENGDYCEPIKAPRRVIIYYSCDEEGKYGLKFTNVFEDKKKLCVYHFYAKSKLLCNPNMIMKNYIKSQGLKTYCYLDN